MVVPNIKVNEVLLYYAQLTFQLNLAYMISYLIGNAYKYLEEAVLDEAPKTYARNEIQDPFNLFIQKGDTVNLNDLLFTKERDYLVKNNNQQMSILSFNCYLHFLLNVIYVDLC